MKLRYTLLHNISSYDSNSIFYKIGAHLNSNVQNFSANTNLSAFFEGYNDNFGKPYNFNIANDLTNLLLDNNDGVTDTDKYNNISKYIHKI